MVRHPIVAKLETQLREGINSEIKAVYLLVELRKLLEYDGKKVIYPVLNFYCNWVVHTKLSRSSIGESIIRHFDSFFELLTTTPTGDIRISRELDQLTNQALLRTELELCLKEYALPTTICSLEESWSLFNDNLHKVIEDCPLMFKTSKTKYVQGISIERIANGTGFAWKVHVHTPLFFRRDEKGAISFLPTPPQP